LNRRGMSHKLRGHAGAQGKRFRDQQVKKGTGRTQKSKTREEKAKKNGEKQNVRHVPDKKEKR